MADQGRWFKLWCDSDDDDLLDSLRVSDFGRWCKLGVHIKKHGTGGNVTLVAPARALCAKFQVPDFRSLCEVIGRLPHVTIRVTHGAQDVSMRRDKPGTDAVTHTVTPAPVTAVVEFSNWKKYQEDTSWERMRRYRNRVAQSVTHTVTAKRRSRSRGEVEEKRSTPLPPPRADAVTPDLEPPGLEPSPPPDPTGPLDCASCQRILARLNQRTARTYNAPGHVGRMLHDRHVQFGVDACLGVVEVKVDECERTGKGWNFIGPNVLFKPENFDTFRNQGPGAEAESDSVRRFRESNRRAIEELRAGSEKPEAN